LPHTAVEILLIDLLAFIDKEGLEKHTHQNFECQLRNGGVFEKLDFD